MKTSKPKTTRTRIQPSTGNRVYLIRDRQGRPVWVTVPQK